MSEVKITLILTPESYDYGVEDIVYRITVNNQLISERSMPLLDQNQAVADTFFLNNTLTKKYYILIQNLKLKKTKYKGIIINDNNLGTIRNIQTRDYMIKVSE